MTCNHTCQPPPTRVTITNGGHQVVVEVPGVTGLDYVATKALAVWEATKQEAEPADEGEPASLGFGLVSDPSPTPLMPPEIQLPGRLIIPEQERPDDGPHC